MGKLLWLASYPKSGTTWLRAFLHNCLRPSEAPYEINRLTDFCAGEALPDLYQRHAPRPANAYSIAEIQRLRPRVHRDLTELSPETVFVKTHNALMTVGGIPLVTPEVTAGAIYVVRDPRDIAVSLSHHMGRTIDATVAFMADPDAATGGDARQIYEHVSSWSRHVETWTRKPSPYLHVVRYEDLHAAPAASFEGVLGFLGLDLDPALVARAIRFSAFETLRGQERAGGFAERPPQADAPFFRAGQAGGWRDVLSGDQAERIERDHGAAMARWGYF
jgi:hypothetical protein